MDRHQKDRLKNMGESGIRASIGLASMRQSRIKDLELKYKTIDRCKFKKNIKNVN